MRQLQFLRRRQRRTLEFMVAADLASAASTRTLAAEAHELVAIFVASRKTVTARLEREKKNKRSRS